MNTSTQQIEAEKADLEGKGALNRIIKRFGGRHLIFRTKTGGWWMIPRPYVLVSSFRGPMWVFYGAGQIWLTHKKLREFGGWLARIPRLANKKVLGIVEALDADITTFVDYCNDHGIEGTIVIETRCIEFHWTFGDELPKEEEKNTHASPLDEQFSQLCDRFLIVKNELGIGTDAG